MPYYGLALDNAVQVLESDPEEKLWSLVLSSLRRALEADVSCKFNHPYLSSIG